MKHSFSALVMALSSSLFFFSCNSGDSKMETTKDTTAVTTTPAPPTPAMPPNVLVITHKVANYTKWKTGYDSDDSARQAAGLANYVVGRGVDDSNMVLVAFKMSDIEKAKGFGASEGLKQKMHKAGVIGEPIVDFVHPVMADTSANGSLRLRITHKVKDWAAWKKVFDGDKQARMDAGLIDRSVGYNIDDSNMVSIVFVVTDIAKAKAFMNSPALKAKMEAGGVEGKPTSFLYNVVQKY